MFNQSGDGGIAPVTVEMKQWNKIDIPFPTEEEADVYLAFMQKTNHKREYMTSVSMKDECYYIWYREKGEQ